MERLAAIVVVCRWDNMGRYSCVSSSFALLLIKQFCFILALILRICNRIALVSFSNRSLSVRKYDAAVQYLVVSWSDIVHVSGEYNPDVLITTLHQQSFNRLDLVLICCFLRGFIIMHYRKESGGKAVWWVG